MPKPVRKERKIGVEALPWSSRICISCRLGEHQECEDAQMPFCACRVQAVDEHVDNLEMEVFG